MMPHSLNGVYLDGSCRVSWEDGERVFCRVRRLGGDGKRSAVLVVLPAAERPSSSSLDRLAHEYGLKDELDAAWAVRPLAFVREGGRANLGLTRVSERHARGLSPPLEKIVQSRRPAYPPNGGSKNGPKGDCPWMETAFKFLGKDTKRGGPACSASVSLVNDETSVGTSSPQSSERRIDHSDLRLGFMLR